MNSFGVVFLAFATSAVTAVGTVYVIEQKHLFRPVEQKVEQAAVPELKGLSEADARANLHAVGLVYLAAPREVSSAVPPGRVTRQSVPAGQQVPKQHPVTVVLADELPKVPEVLRLTQAEATSKLQQAGYKVEVGPSVADAVIPEGAVVTQAPAAGSALAKDQSVQLTLSSGSEPVEVPKIVGLNVTKAQTDLEKLGFKVNVRWVSVAETATYIVLSQDPPAKTKAKPGTVIQLSANR
ncbi:MAG TPA: PASTA domain-containing protein [Polyangiaceae bacterium]|nr:PASTA domain-containing protein [Polyangiaceae bacterium]